MESPEARRWHWTSKPWRSVVVVMLMLGTLLGGNLITAAQPPREQKFLYVIINDAINVYDINNGHTLAKTIEMPGYERARGVQASAARGLLYVTYLDTPMKGAALVAIDLRTDDIVWTKLYPGADAISITPDSATIFLSSGEGSNRDYFSVLDAATGEERTRIPVYEHTHNGLVSPLGDRAYLSSLEYRYLVEADTTTFEVTKKIGPFGDGIRPFTVNGRGTLAFVNVNHLQGFEVGDLTTGEVLYRVVIPGNPNKQEDPSHGIGMTPDEREIWVAGETNYVYRFDATQMPPRLIDAIKLRRQPKWVSMSIDGRYIYPGSGDVVDRVSGAVIATYPNTKRQIEVDFVDGVPSQAGDMYARGQITGRQDTTPTPSMLPTTTTQPPVAETTEPVTPSPVAPETATPVPTPAGANTGQVRNWLPLLSSP